MEHKQKYVNIKSNLKGFMVSSDQYTESKCVREMLDLFTQYADKFYPQDPEEVKEVVSFEEELSKELESVKVGARKRFFTVPTNLKGVSFIRITDKNIPSTTLLSKIFNYMNENKDTCFKTRHTSRVIPIEGTCACNLESVMRLANNLIPPHFHPPQKPSKYKVDIKRRANNSFPRDQFTREVVKLINYKNTVDMKNPDKIIIVEIFKGAAAMSVVSIEDFKHGFNIRKLLSEGMSGIKKRDREESVDSPPITKKQKIENTTNPIKDEKKDENDESKQQEQQTTTDTNQPKNQQDDSEEDDFRIFAK